MKLILVGGTGRSGTSLVYYRLSLNNEVCGYPEFESRLFTINNSLLDVYDIYVNSYSPERFDYICAAFKQSVLNIFANLPCGKLISLEISKKPNRMMSRYLDEFISGLRHDRLTSLSMLESFQRYAEVLMVKLFKFDPIRKKVLIEKTPHNVLHFNRIKAVFPEAKLLHIIRDPRAVAESVTRQLWGAKSYKEAVIWVKLILETWIRQYKNREFDIESCRCIRVEDLVARYEEKENLIREFTGEKLEKLMLFANPDALDGWRSNISDDEFEYANEELKDIMQFFSYSAELINSTEQTMNTELRIK